MLVSYAVINCITEWKKQTNKLLKKLIANHCKSSEMNVNDMEFHIIQTDSYYKR